jgi:hypothetical protein
MKRLLFASFSTFFSLMVITDAFGQAPPPAKMSSSTQTSSSIQSIQQSPFKSEPLQGAKPSAPQPLPEPVAPPALIPEQAEYLHPGILVNMGGRWEGSDHLLNVSSNIGVYVSLVKPESEVLNVTEIQLRKEVENIFTLSNIKPQILVTAGKPPLPAFEIEIFVYPIEKGYAAYCSGRLFESVVLERFKMDSNMAFQAITWEKQNLIVSPKEQFATELTKTVQDIAKTFGERFQAYERIKRSL